MAYTAHDPRLFYAAVASRLSSQTGKNVEVGRAPASTTTPYAVVYPLDEDDDPETQGDLADPHRGTFFVWQVTSVGADDDETLWMQQKVRAALVGWQPTVSGITCGFAERDGGDGLRREDGAQPARLRTADTFRCFATA